MDILTLAIAKSKSGSPNGTITTENITNALGYKPADQEEVSKLSEDIVDLENDVSEMSEDVANVKERVEYLEENNTSGTSGTGLSETAINLLISILKQGLYSSNQSSNIEALKNELTSAEIIPATGISLNASSLMFTSKSSQTLKATVTPSNTTDRVVWSSSNSSIATVKNGVVTAVSNGSCTITATAGTVSTTCAVNVEINESTGTEDSIVVSDGVMTINGLENEPTVNGNILLIS